MSALVCRFVLSGEARRSPKARRRKRRVACPYFLAARAQGGPQHRSARWRAPEGRKGISRSILLGNGTWHQTQRLPPAHRRSNGVAGGMLGRGEISKMSRRVFYLYRWRFNRPPLNRKLGGNAGAARLLALFYKRLKSSDFHRPYEATCATS